VAYQVGLADRTMSVKGLALGRACLGWKEDSLFHESGFEPLAQELLVSGNMAEHPLVFDVVKTSANAAFQNPPRSPSTGEHQIALSNGVRRASARPKAVEAVS